MERTSRRDLAHRITILIEIAAVAIVILSAGAHFWNYYHLSAIDPSLQIAFIAALILMVSILANVIVNRQW